MLHVFVSPERSIVPRTVNIVNIALNCQSCFPYCQYCSQLLSMRAIVNVCHCQLFSMRAIVPWTVSIVFKLPLLALINRQCIINVID